MAFTVSDILEQLDLAYAGEPSEYFPSGRPQDIKYNFFLDLEHGYCETAGSRIHLFADEGRWAIVFEKSGYKSNGATAEIELNYVGNCISYPVHEYPERNYITNASIVTLIDQQEYQRIEHGSGIGLEPFGLIDPATQNINVRDIVVAFDNDYNNYKKVGISVRDYANPKKLISFSNFLRYLHETTPDVVRAKQDEIQRYIPKDLSWLITINEFHVENSYAEPVAPSVQETYRLIAEVLVTKNKENWQPTKSPNNHWSNWESGFL